MWITICGYLLSILFCSFIFFLILWGKKWRDESLGGEEENDKTVFPIQSALLFLFPAWFKAFVTWVSRRWYKNLSIWNVAACWIQSSNHLAALPAINDLRQVRGDGRWGGWGLTIPIVSQRILHGHILRVTANEFCFASDSRSKNYTSRHMVGVFFPHLKRTKTCRASKWSS